MTDFKAKMHQIRFRLGRRPRPRWGSLQHSPRPPSWIWGPTSKERGRDGREERGREKREGEGRGGKERGGEGKGHEPPTIRRKFTPMPTSKIECCPEMLVILNAGAATSAAAAAGKDLSSISSKWLVNSTLLRKSRKR